MTKDEALKLALDFVASISPAFICEATHHKKNERHTANEPCPHVAKQKATYEAIKEALAQPAVTESHKQEPVAWSYWQSCLNDDGTQTAPWVHRLSKFQPSESIINKDITPLYTTPPQRKPLTDEETYKIQTSVGYSGGFSRFVGIVRAIEAAHGIYAPTERKE